MVQHDIERPRGYLFAYFQVLEFGQRCRYKTCYGREAARTYKNWLALYAVLGVAVV